MGPCCGSSNSRGVVEKPPKSQQTEQDHYQAKFKFEKRPLLGDGSEHFKTIAKKYASIIDKPLEEKIPTPENVIKMRQESEEMTNKHWESQKEKMAEILSKITATEEMVTMRDGTQIKMLVYRPNTLTSQSAPCYFYAHGGGAFMLSAKNYEKEVAETALYMDCVAFNIDYRLAPENKSPKGQEDYVDCINHVFANPGKYGVNPNKSAISGCSGGGWVVTGAANLLAKANDLGKIKALIIQTGMLSNSTYNLPKDQLEPWDTEWFGHPDIMTGSYKLLASDFENQHNDDQLYPGKASNEILKKYPPTVIFTGEVDFMRRDNELFAERLKKVGKLAEISVMPGATHGYWHHDIPEAKLFFEDMRLCFNALVTNSD